MNLECAIVGKVIDNSKDTNPYFSVLPTQRAPALCFQFNFIHVTVSHVLTEAPVVMMTKMFHYIIATALTTTVVRIVKVRDSYVNK